MSTTKTALAYGDDFFADVSIADLISIQNMRNDSATTITDSLYDYLQTSDNKAA